MFHRHRWKWYAARQTETYESPSSPHPYLIETEISGVCTGCGEPRIKVVKGTWRMPDA